MNEDFEMRQLNHTRLAADIFAAYVSTKHVQVADLPNLLNTVHASVQAGTAAAASASVHKPSSAEIKRTVSRDVLISFEDGKGYKTLKRHLTTRGLTPQSYREKWGLPKDYPMVAPSYAERRSALAKAIGLGRPGESGATRADVGALDEPQSRSLGKVG